MAVDHKDFVEVWFAAVMVQENVVAIFESHFHFDTFVFRFASRHSDSPFLLTLRGLGARRQSKIRNNINNPLSSLSVVGLD